MSSTVPEAATIGAPSRVSRAVEFGRKWDVLLILVLVPGFAALAFITDMLLVGDWDFWLDWKDREWWPLVTPMVGIVIPAAGQYILWRLMRVAGGATAAVTLLVLMQWVSRLLSFHALGHYPLNFVAPATMVPLGIVLDATLVLTRSFAITAVAGGIAWGLLFQPANAALFGAMWQPVTFHNDQLTVADVMGFEYIRSQAPAYLRIVEHGHLRAFLSQISVVTAFTAGLMSIFGYYVGVWIGRVVAIAPSRVFVATESPLLRWLHPGVGQAPDTPRDVPEGQDR